MIFFLIMFIFPNKQNYIIHAVTLQCCLGFKNEVFQLRQVLDFLIWDVSKGVIQALQDPTLIQR